MSETSQSKNDPRLARRDLMRLGAVGLGTVSLGSVLWQGGAAHAAAGPTPGTLPSTSILGADGAAVTLTTGPFQSFAMPAGSRLGVCLVVGGSKGRGRFPLVQEVSAAELTGVGNLGRDPGVARGVYRLLDAFSVERPVELYGFSTAAGAELGSGQTVELTWTAQTHGLKAGTAELRGYLEGFHALVIGRLSEDGRFTGQLSYVEIDQVA